MFVNKTLLITGGTGSFGSKVLNHLLDTDIKEIRIFSRDEKKQEDMRIKLKNPKVKFYIGDVRDFDSINRAMRGVNYVFHAAALKQVPSCEFHPIEAVKTNILGAENTLNAALNNAVERMTVLSTDKAVNPINAMGVSKSMMEKLMIAKSREAGKNDTVFCGVRYGNVMVSRGSVIPLFINQIKENKQITVTDPSMTRFMMFLSDSVELVLNSFKYGKGGDIFVQKAPACTIDILAKALKKIFKSDNEIKYLGTRHGEKQHESLVSREEMAKVEDLGKYYRIPADNRDLNYANYAEYFSKGEKHIAECTDYTSANTTQLDLEQTIELLLQLDYVKEQLNA
ncbi:MAG: polysaccharide biosynthesis protein [Rickettsiaceae bacterium]|nr:polysaccharide biosynthesis protein [Rickettsiaceae bacterium]